MAELVRGSAAGVPFVARPPEGGAPLMVLWHGFDPPRSEAAMAGALPLLAIPAWRVYLGLPMFGARAPAGGPEEIARLSTQDFLQNVYAPIVEGAARELPAVVSELESTLPIRAGAPIGLVGFSAGGAAALEAIATGATPVATAAIISPVVNVISFMASVEQYYGMPYAWTDESRARGSRLNFVDRAAELVTASPPPAILLTVGDQDPDISAQVDNLHTALQARYADPDRLSARVITGQEHGFVPEPGIDPAPPTPTSADVDVDAIITDWFRRYPLEAR